jgi:hypothetical protein
VLINGHWPKSHCHFLASILATFFCGVLVFIPKLTSSAHAAPSRPFRPGRQCEIEMTDKYLQKMPMQGQGGWWRSSEDANARSRWVMKIFRRCQLSQAERPYCTAWSNWTFKNLKWLQKLSTIFMQWLEWHEQSVKHIAVFLSSYRY